jgi:DNA-binding response OmpR family regulator
MPQRIAVVEDESELGELVEYNLARSGYEVRVLDGARDTLRSLEQIAPDLIVLDVMLPETDGFDLCRQIRRSPGLGAVPVIFLTARSDEVDRVLGLELGGDDYIVKPFSPRELVARVKARLRRSGADAAPAELCAGRFRLDRAARRAFLDGGELSLTAIEYSLLEFFLAHPGRVFSREQLLQSVWGEHHYITPRTVDVHVRRLRERIEERPDDPRRLVTVRGFGYRFEDPA